MLCVMFVNLKEKIGPKLNQNLFELVSEEMRTSQVAVVVKLVASNALVPVDGHRRWLLPTFARSP